MRRYQRSLGELWDLWKRFAYTGVYPFEYCNYDDIRHAFGQLTSYDPDAWARVFCAAAAPNEARARELDATGDRDAAKAAYLRAYGCYRMARYPTLSSEGKKAAYPRSQQMFLAAARYFDPPIERVVIPFDGREGEGREVIGYLRSPRPDGDRSTPRPLMVHWGGIDSFKEERNRFVDPFLDRGIAVLLIDIPGTGDAPVVGSLDAERMFAAVLDWIAGRPELDSGRVCCYGASFGGYWATKVAHLYGDRITCVVNQGGCAHHAFELEWMEKAQWGEYAFDHAETRAHTFGFADVDAWLEFAPQLSLLRMGLLDRPCAPMLLVNGIHDSVVPIQDMYLLFEHGSPKTARFYPKGHMGHTPQTMPMIVAWVAAMLEPRR